jgi:LemA protein
MGALVKSLLVLALVLAVIVLPYVIFVFNSLVSLKNNIKKAWANIDVLLKQRYDEIPNLVEIVKGYMKHEKKVLEELTSMRTAMMIASSKNEMARLSDEVSGTIKSIFAVAENYPKLQASQSFLKLQERISSLENEIADRRELYNDSVNIYNTKIESFPDVLVAKMFKYSREEPFSALVEEKANVKVKIDK